MDQQPAKISHERTQFLSGVRITGFWTLASRILGMVRDVATAALFGLVGGGVMDAFVIAFRIPNLFRRLFGEGALSASYLPVLSETLEQDRKSAWQLVSVLLTWLAIVLSLVVLVAEAICGALWLLDIDPRLTLVAGLSAVMLPYLLLICLAAQVSATLHALNHFSVPAFVPILLNVSWIVGVLVVAPYWSDSKTAQAYVLAFFVLIGGVLQLTAQLPMLRRFGFRFDYNWAASRTGVRRVTTALLPMLLGLAVTQINTLMDSLIAWGLSSSIAKDPIDWLGGSLTYPVRDGAAAAIYFGERLYQLPLGLLGIAVATVIFPLLSRHAARGDRTAMSANLTLGLRLVMFLAIPASAGLVLLAQPLTTLLFQHGEFTAGDSARTGRLIACYGLGVWAYCALPVLVRGFYALNDYRTPLHVGGLAVALNLVLNLSLVWTFAEMGLALATALAAAVQAIVLAALVARRTDPLGWPALFSTLARSLLATLLMAGAGLLILDWLPLAESWWSQLVRVVVPLGGCLVVYVGVFGAIGGSEWRLLVGRQDEGV